MANKQINIKVIQNQSRHKDVKTLMGYIQPTYKENRDGYLQGISLNNQEQNTQKPINNQEPIKPTTPNPTPIKNDNTDSYIAKGNLKE
jgi:hypothetical protein